LMRWIKQLQSERLKAQCIFSPFALNLNST